LRSLYDTSEYQAVYDDLHRNVSESAEYLEPGPSRYQATRRLHAVVQSVLRTNAERFLDIGCGDGIYAIIFASLRHDYVGCDVSLVNLRRVFEWSERKGLDQRINLVLCEISYLPFREKAFEMTVCSEVIEHLLNLGPALEAMSRVTENLIISTPCIGFPLVDLALTTRVLKWSMNKRRVIRQYGTYVGLMRIFKETNATHTNLFTLTLLKALFRKAGMEVTKVEGAAFQFPFIDEGRIYNHRNQERFFSWLEETFLKWMPLFDILLVRLGHRTVILRCSQANAREPGPSPSSMKKRMRFFGLF